MHPVTRLGRIIQQLQSFGELHANELEGMALELDAAGSAEVASRVRAYRDVQRDEAAMVVQELEDIRGDMAAEAPAQEVLPPNDGRDPAINSPRRAKWLAEQEAEAERLRQPVSRRELFERIANPTDEGQEDQ